MSRAAAWAVVLGASLAALGWWLPWVIPERGTAALVLLGLDLGEFWKFTAEWRGGLFALERLFFFLPPPLAAMTLTLWVAGARGWGRWLLLPLLLFLSVVILPAFEFVREVLKENPLVYEDGNLAREFSFQFYLALGSLLVVGLLPLWHRAGERLRSGFVALLAGAGALLPAWALWRTWLVLQGFYGDGALLGPGIFLTSGGFALALAGASYHLKQKGKT
ncbi:MAG: hypothetical protein H0T73_20825 [Ardenticatenales bacterium]|nr:hypothetical protein [Ardenticatenales bacterium]